MESSRGKTADTLAQQVKSANEKFYNTVGSTYESIDTRRDPARSFAWLQSVLLEIRQKLPATDAKFLDIASGSGFLARQALPHFSEVWAADISQKMLEALGNPNIRTKQCDCEKLDFPAESFDCIGAFAALHHIYDPTLVFQEAFRVLRPGGIFYSDHDIEKHFVENFSLPLRAYRKLFDHSHDFLESFPSLSEHEYKLSEFHGDTGLSGTTLEASLKTIGFSQVKMTYHWEGLLSFTPPWKRKGLSPLLRILALK